MPSRRLAALGMGRAALEEDQPELPDLYFVTAAERRFLDPLPVHVRTVQAANVAHGEYAAMPVELRVPPRDRDIIEEDVAVRPPADLGQLAVEQEPAACVGPAPDHQQRGVGR